MHEDPDLAFAVGEERVLRTVGRGALWLTTVLTAVALAALWVRAPLGTAEAVAFLAPGALFGAYAVSRGAGLLPLAVAAGTPLLAALCALAVASLFGFFVPIAPDAPAVADAATLAALAWAAPLAGSLLVGLPARALLRRA